jgi:DNA-binding CsgD family transcriptional regulator
MKFFASAKFRPVETFNVLIMTPREKQICRLILKKRTTKEIAFDLAISVSTVRVHLANLYRRYALRGKSDLIFFLFGERKRLN